MAEPNDTIVAIATPTGRGGIGIVRTSGPGTRAIGEAILGTMPQPRYAAHRIFLDEQGTPLDDGIAIFYPAPNSFTGEDVLELQGHGGPVVLDMMLRRCVELGARIARPGEFSERAFLNDKLDLAQAEAVADLIDSGTEQAARAALRSLQGEFSRRIHALVDRLIELRIYIEAAIDFPEEEVDFISDSNVRERIALLQHDFGTLQHSAQQGVLLREGIHLVIAGRPNAGKSSLLNALAGRESAIVTHIPGTTRDVLREQIQIDGMPVHIVDTAGLRDTDDHVEQIGVRRAWDEIARADRVLLVVDDQAGITAEDRDILDRLPKGPELTVIRNKIDLSRREPTQTGTDKAPEIALSAKTGAGLDLLRAHLKQAVGFVGGQQGEFMARRRHLDDLERASCHVDSALVQITESQAGELAAEELRQAQQALSEITGAFTSDDLLGRIFSSFCIGK
jgi:tRNA modification GTPase